MNFSEMFNTNVKSDVLLIQPHILKHVSVEDIDIVQQHYWDASDKVGSLIGDLPIEPNWGLLYLSSALKHNDFSVHMLDFHLYDYVKYTKTGNFIDYDDIEKILSTKKSAMVAISSLTRSHHRALKIAEICKKINPECKVVLGGIHFTFIAEEAIKSSPYVDVVIRGEGEKAIVDLMKNLNDIDKWSDLEGIVYLDRNGKIVNDNKINHIEDINKLAYPDYSLWPSDVPLIPRIYLSRGCIGNCDYCVANLLFKSKQRKRNMDDVMNEIKMLYYEYKIEEMLIGDLCFPSSKKDTIDFCKRIIDSGMKIRWWCQTRPEILDDEILGYMEKAGCVQVALGIESSDPDVLEKTNSKKYGAKVTQSIFDICSNVKKYNIAIQGYFIIGLPGDTIDTSIQTIKMMDYLTAEGLVDIMHISVMVPYPGTNLISNHDLYGLEIIDNDYSHYLMNCDLMNAGVPVYKTNTLDNYQIFSLWQLALSTVAKNFEKRNIKDHIMFNALNNFVNEIEV